MGKKIFLIILLLVVSCGYAMSNIPNVNHRHMLQVNSVYAISVPSYPSCTFPTGEWKTHYDEGSHGIPGDMAQHLGEDDVYTINDTLTYQCFCADNGEGIQTNWWKIPGLPQPDIDYLKRLGWVYVPDGNLWGLTGDPYMALSTTYDCSGGGVGGPDVLGAWAPTGNKPQIYFFGILGFVSLVLGLTLKKIKKA